MLIGKKAFADGTEIKVIDASSLDGKAYIVTHNEANKGLSGKVFWKDSFTTEEAAITAISKYIQEENLIEE
jgi:hypothetical protein